MEFLKRKANALYDELKTIKEGILFIEKKMATTNNQAEFEELSRGQFKLMMEMASTKRALDKQLDAIVEEDPSFARALGAKAEYLIEAKVIHVVRDV